MRWRFCTLLSEKRASRPLGPGYFAGLGTSSRPSAKFRDDRVRGRAALTAIGYVAWSRYPRSAGASLGSALLLPTTGRLDPTPDAAAAGARIEATLVVEVREALSDRRRACCSNVVRKNRRPR